MSPHLEAQRDRIVRIILDSAENHGWSARAIDQAIATEKFSPAEIKALFPDGLQDIVAHFSDMIDRLMLAELEQKNGEALRVRDKIQTAIMVRFRILQNYREATRHAVTFWTVPPRTLIGARVLWRTADRMWIWAGDQARDYNRYTKRALLTGVLTAAMMAWLQNPQGDLASLEEFVNRRIDNVLKIGQYMGRLQNRAV